MNEKSPLFKRAFLLLHIVNILFFYSKGLTFKNIAL